MVNYTNAKIYRIDCDDGYFYYGSTCQTLVERKYGHKQKINTRNSKLYRFLKQCKNWDLVFIEDYPCESKRELLERENQYVTRFLDDEKCLNSFKCRFDRDSYFKSYYENNRLRMIEYAKKYQKNRYIEV